MECGERDLRRMLQCIIRSKFYCIVNISRKKASKLFLPGIWLPGFPLLYCCFALTFVGAVRFIVPLPPLFPMLVGVGGTGGLFGYATPAQLRAMSEYRSLYEAAALSSQTAARTAFETPKIPPTTSVSSTPSSLLSSSSSSTNPPNTANGSTNISSTFSSIPGTQGLPGGVVGPSRINGALQPGKMFPGATNMIDWPELSLSSQPAVGSKRGGGAGGGGGRTNVPAATTTASAVSVSSGTTGGPSSTTGTVGSGVLLNSNVGTWNGSMGNAGMGNGTGTAKDSTTAAVGTSTPATAARSKGQATMVDLWLVASVRSIEECIYVIPSETVIPICMCNPPVAQLVERSPRLQSVVGSNPT